MNYCRNRLIYNDITSYVAKTETKLNLEKFFHKGRTHISTKNNSLALWKVLVVSSPYRKTIISNPHIKKLNEQVYSMMKSVTKEHDNVDYIDLNLEGNIKFDENDFSDHLHLNQGSAERLSHYLKKYVD